MASIFQSMKSSQKTLIMIVFASLAVIVGLVLIYFQVNNLRELNSQIEEEEIALEGARTQLARRMGYRERAPEYRELIRQFRILIPEQPEENNILRYLGNLAFEYDLYLIDLSFGERDPKPDQNYIGMPLSIRMQGNYSGLLNFLNHLYSGERAIRVDSISITSNGEVPANIIVIVSAYAFYSPDEI